MIRLPILILLTTLAFCKTGQKSLADNTPFVELKTGACFGYCPVFRLTVRNNGWVDYEGLLFAERQGSDSFQLTKAELGRLRTKVKQVDLWQYPDHIKSDVMDAPSATLSVFKAGTVKSVLGSIDRPAPLLELEDLLKDMAEAHDFQVKRGVNPNEPPLHSRREVIVRLQPEINAGNWIQQFTEFRFLLVRRVSEENMWVVAYDPKQIDEKAVLALFKESKGAIDAQTNKTVKDRE